VWPQPPERTYRFTVRSSARAAATAAVLGCLFLVGPSLAATITGLRLDGTPLRPELALTPAQRGLGLMQRQKAPKDGMLFVFPAVTSDGFWMKHTLVPLTVVFFDAAGHRVRRLSMSPCTADPCPVYYPHRRYRFALELPATDTRAARLLGPPAALRRLAARAT
jgi:uncharacterized membrane protein (UPF0127 family)